MLFKYVIQYGLDYDIKIEAGIVGASSWKDACERLIQYFGEEHMIEIKSIYQLENPLSDEELKEVFEKE